MKTLLTILTLLTITCSVSAQRSYDDLIKQSHKARTTSTIFVVAGPVIAAGGIGTIIYGVIANTEINANRFDGYYDANGNFIYYPTKKHSAEIIVGAAGALAGIALAITSIHFSNKANNLKREARKAKLKTSTDRISIPGMQNGYATNRARQFKISLMIPLCK